MKSAPAKERRTAGRATEPAGRRQLDLQFPASARRRADHDELDRLWRGAGVERVDLPNGRTVDALKIEFFERPSAMRYRFELHVVEWFAPEINRYVRREIESRLAGEVTESTTETLQDYVRRR